MTMSTFLARIDESIDRYVLNPEEDLRPVCANCHAMLHCQKTAIGIEELEAKLKLTFSTAFASRSPRL